VGNIGSDKCSHQDENCNSSNAHRTHGAKIEMIHGLRQACILATLLFNALFAFVVGMAEAILKKLGSHFSPKHSIESQPRTRAGVESSIFSTPKHFSPPHPQVGDLTCGPPSSQTMCTHALTTQSEKEHQVLVDAVVKAANAKQCCGALRTHSRKSATCKTLIFYLYLLHGCETWTRTAKD
jgi:hypothetical protein